MIMLPEGKMSTEEKMNIDERWKYLRMMRRRYEQGRRQECKRLLDEMEAVTGLHRKSLIRLMNGSLERKPRQRQRSRVYGVEVDGALRVIAESWDYICALVLYPVPVGPGQVRPSTGPNG
jgi:protein-disulfide isomerase-like protein with CxxC motif